MDLLNILLPGGNSDKAAEEEQGEKYDVCDRHGHDYREAEFEEMDVSFHTLSPFRSVDGIRRSVIPGKALGIQYLLAVEVKHCRDCPKEVHSKDTIEKRIVFANNGSVKTMDEAQYQQRASDSVDEQR